MCCQSVLLCTVAQESVFLKDFSGNSSVELTSATTELCVQFRDLSLSPLHIWWICMFTWSSCWKWMPIGYCWLFSIQNLFQVLSLHRFAYLFYGILILLILKKYHFLCVLFWIFYVNNFMVFCFFWVLFLLGRKQGENFRVFLIQLQVGQKM